MPGEEELQKLQPPTNNVEGTAAPLPEPQNFMPAEGNLPQPDEGTELTSQSYDVRANKVQNPEQETGFFSKLGASLAGMLGRSPEVSPSSVSPQGSQVGDEMPPTETSQAGMIPSGIFDKLGEHLSQPLTAQGIGKPSNIGENFANELGKPYHGMTHEGLLEGAKNYMTEGYTPKVHPNTYEQFPNLQKPPATPEQTERKQLDQRELDEAMKNPGEVMVYGATDEFANNPELVESFSTYTGLPFDEMTKEMTSGYEKILDDINKGLDESYAGYTADQAAARQRIENNQANDSDKYFIGLALLMPLLIGGMFGKEAALGALGGGAQGISDVLKGRQENIRKDEKQITDIEKEKSNIRLKQGEMNLERIKLPETIKKGLPKDEYEDLKNLPLVEFKDPKTGKVIASGAEVYPDMYMDMKYANTEKKRDKMREAASDLNDEKAAIIKANVASEKIIKAANQLKDSGLFAKMLAYSLSDDKDSATKKFLVANAPKIKIDGREQNSAVYLDSQIELMKDAYRRNEQMKAFTATISNHIGGMIGNPRYSNLQPSDLIDQVLSLRDRGQHFFLDKAKGKGFLSQPLEKIFGNENKQVYKGLNRKEENKIIDKDMNLLYGEA